MRAMWSGAVSFGLVSVPVKLYSATTNHDIRFHQVHGADGGRIRYKRVCTVCGQEVEYADIVKGYETEDGELITLTEADLESLPLSSSREIEVVEFVPADQVDPLLLDKSYYLEPETKAAKPYALLREALRQTDRMAVVKVALRQKEALALLRVRDNVIVLQTMLWPDEVRAPEFEILDSEVELRTQEMAMAASLIDSLGAEFEPTRFADDYLAAVTELIERKRSTGETRPAPTPVSTGANGVDSMADLLTALERSVEAARAGSAIPTQRGGTPADSPADEPAKPAKARKPAATKSGADKPAAAKSGAAGRKRATAAAKKADASADTDERKPARRTRRPA